MPQKSTVPSELKVKAVRECLEGKTSENHCAKKYGVGLSSLRSWIRLYKNRGEAGLIPASKTRKYAPEIKIQAIKDYQSGEGSLEEICIKYDISDHSMLRRWIKRYNSHKDFKQPNTGGAVYMGKGRSTTIEERIEIVSDCISNNKDYGKAIEKYGVSYQQIYSWVRKYESRGVEGLKDGRGKAREETSMSEVDKLKAQVKLKEAENLRLQMENDLLKKLAELERWDT